MPTPQHHQYITALLRALGAGEDTALLTLTCALCGDAVEDTLANSFTELCDCCFMQTNPAINFNDAELAQYTEEN